MSQSLKPLVSSFILRFVQEQSQLETGNRTYRGSIRHIQSEEEVQFTQWEDAVTFIQQFVSLDQITSEFKLK